MGSPGNTPVSGSNPLRMGSNGRSRGTLAGLSVVSPHWHPSSSTPPPMANTRRLPEVPWDRLPAASPSPVRKSPLGFSCSQRGPRGRARSRQPGLPTKAAPEAGTAGSPARPRPFSPRSAEAPPPRWRSEAPLRGFLKLLTPSFHHQARLRTLGWRWRWGHKHLNGTRLAGTGVGQRWWRGDRSASNAWPSSSLVQLRTR